MKHRTPRFSCGTLLSFLGLQMLILGGASSWASSTDPRPYPELPLPAGVSPTTRGLRFVDLNGDGEPDVIFSNEESYGIFLFNRDERKSLGWALGWTQIIREGKAGDPGSIPLTTASETKFHDGAMWIRGQKKMSYTELCRPPVSAPLSPEAGLRALRLRLGFKAELVAHEPLVQDPIFVDWDARGRMWVVEMGDYPFHEYNGKTYSGRVKILEDTNGDGIYDKATVFLDNLTYPTGLACWGRGAFIASVPDIFFAEDTDDDGKADKQTTFFTGFKQGNPQHLVNGFVWGLDGWLYGGNGDSGGTVTEVRSGKTFDLSGRDFCFNPVSGEFQLQSGRAQYGRWRDDYGNWFANNNSSIGWHYLYDDKQLGRNPNVALPSVKQDLNPNGKTIYPVSTPVARFNQPAAVNVLTSACNPIPYRDVLFGGDFTHSVFICEPANNLVHREVLEPSGVSFSSHRASDEAASEFMASTDNWSRFTQARTGPDGSLFVVDMVRLIIEHPEWIPSQLLAHLDLRAGSELGRIYRVRPTTATNSLIPNLMQMGESELAKALESSNGWVRDTAQRLLIERGSHWTPLHLKGSVPAQIQQLWTAHILGTLDKSLLLSAMEDTSPEIRLQGVRVAEFYLKADQVVAKLVELSRDPDLKLRVAVAMTLGVISQDPRLSAVWETFEKNDTTTPAMLVALLNALPEHTAAAIWQEKLTGKTKGKAPTSLPKTVTNYNPDREEVVRSYASVDTLLGDPSRGHQIYVSYCSGCHRLKGEGNEMGPDLETIASKPTNQLLEAILDPSRAVEQRYLAHTLSMKDGRKIFGLIAEENANSLRVAIGGGASETVLRTQVGKIETSTKSLMPDGLEKLLSREAMADVISWIRKN